MRRVVERLFREAALERTDRFSIGTPVPAAEQAAALECMVMFPSGQSIRGSLSKTPEGGLRMLSVSQDNGQSVLVEQFFDYSAVAAVALVRPVAVAPSTRVHLPKQ
jgi:hypothetical protein